jgi:hypothetical protein
MAARKPLESILRMKGGDDELSYARNCSSQVIIDEKILTFFWI